ncbi:MAG: hypothetical protein K8H84_07845 [Sulfuricella denitrificans]|nr:hypothetical protein [Sulfuricella denitrificans]
MGTSSSSSASSTTIQDNRVAGAPQSVTLGMGSNFNGNVSIESSDPKVVNAAFDFGGRALDTVDRGVEASLRAASAATSAAIEATSATAANAISSNNSVTSNAMALSDRAIGTVASSFYDALGYSAHITDLALEQSNRVDSIAQGAIQQVAQGYESAKSLQVNAGTVDNKYLIAVGMVVVGVFAVKAWGK